MKEGIFRRKEGITMTLEERIQRLEDMEEIRKIMNIYSQSLDKGDKADFMTIWEEDAYLELPSKVTKGKEEIDAWFDTLMKDVIRMHHHNTNVVIEVNGESATAVSDVIHYNEYTSNGKPFLKSGIYRSEFSKKSGRWLFKSRAYSAQTIQSPIY